MAQKTVNNIKLGAFVLAGMLFLILLLYMIGKNRNLFGATYTLKARFENVHGLVAGNNVRFSGIQAGTVKKIRILNDTTIEVSMLIDKKMLDVIRKDATVSIGTDGLVGNKVVNIFPSRQPSPLAQEGDILVSRKAVDTEEMMEILYHTNKDVAVIAGELKKTVQQVNNSSALWTLLNDQSIPGNLRLSIARIRDAAGRADKITEDIHQLITGVKNGKGTLGAVLVDSALAIRLDEAIRKIGTVGEEADSLAATISNLVKSIEQDIHNGKGVANALLRDTAITGKLQVSLDNIQKGTESFNQNMEALKHNFLLRGYFRKLEKQERKSKSTNTGSY